MKLQAFGALAAATVFAAGVGTATAASACITMMYHDPATGRDWAEYTPEGLALRQSELRGRADAIVMAQVSRMQLTGDYNIDLTFTAVRPLYEDTDPGGIVMTERRIRSQVCDQALQIGDFALVYADYDEQTGWSPLAVFLPKDLQDRPEGYDSLLGKIETGRLAPPAYDE